MGPAVIIDGPGKIRHLPLRGQCAGSHEGNPRHRRNHGCKGQSPLPQHTAVADEACIVHMIHLLGGRTGSDKAVKAADGTTGDCDEQERDHRRCAVVHHHPDGRSLN